MASSLRVFIREGAQPLDASSAVGCLVRVLFLAEVLARFLFLVLFYLRPADEWLGSVVF